MGQSNQKSETSAPAGGYVVGFGRPPQASRFKKGQSGNPSGRPSTPKNNIASELRELLQGPLQVKTSQGRRFMSQEEALIRSIVAGALRCDQKAFAWFLKLAKLAGELKDLKPQFNPIRYFKVTGSEEIAEIERDSSF